jgi:hypothetical protein
LRYGKSCTNAFSAQHPSYAFGSSPLIRESAFQVKGALDAEKAKAISQKMTDLIEKNDPNVWRNPDIAKKQILVLKPLETLGDEYLQILNHPQMKKSLTDFFHGNYAVTSVMALRSLVTTEKDTGSWLWHSDCYPTNTCKMFLHLTRADGETGATEFLSPEDTMNYRDAGYFGQYKHERRGDLDLFAKDHHLPYKPFHLDAAPGDVTVFNMNYLHRAVSPRAAIRDIVEIFMMPSPIPWEEHYALNKEYLASPKYGFPKDPRELRTDAVMGMA